jgi:hypothetical protein
MGAATTHRANRGDQGKGYDACAREIDQGSQREDKQRHIQGSDRSPPCNGRVSRSALRMCRWRPFPERDRCVGESLESACQVCKGSTDICVVRQKYSCFFFPCFFSHCHSVSNHATVSRLTMDWRSLEEGLVCHGWRSE